MKILKEAKLRLGSALYARNLNATISELRASKARLEKDNANLSIIRESLNQKEQQLRKLRRDKHALPDPEQDQDRIEIFRRLLGELPVSSYLDLGCGHGKFAVAAADMGWSVRGVDVRTQRLPEDNRIEWVQADVTEYEFDPSSYGAISVLGLLYHLDLPAQLNLLKRCSMALTILDTHVGIDEEVEESGYKGTYYDEPGASEEERKNENLRASWGNARSFWPTEDSLVRMCRDCGFSLVAPVRPPHRKDRTFYVCYP